MQNLLYKFKALSTDLVRSYQLKKLLEKTHQLLENFAHPGECQTKEEPGKTLKGMSNRDQSEKITAPHSVAAEKAGCRTAQVPQTLAQRWNSFLNLRHLVANSLMSHLLLPRLMMSLTNVANNSTLESPSPQWDTGLLVNVSERAIIHYDTFFLENSVFLDFYHSTNTHTYTCIHICTCIYIYVYIFSLGNLHPGLPKSGAGQEHQCCLCLCDCLKCFKIGINYFMFCCFALWFF